MKLIYKNVRCCCRCAHVRNQLLAINRYSRVVTLSARHLYCQSKGLFALELPRHHTLVYHYAAAVAPTVNLTR